MTTESSEPASRDGRIQLLAVAAYIVLAAYPLLAAAVGSEFWSSGTGPASLAIFAALAVALVARRRWAWWTLLFVEVLSLLAVMTGGDVVAVAVQAARLALLLSPPVRWYFAPGGADEQRGTADRGGALLPGPRPRPNLAAAIVLMLVGVLLTPFSVAAVALGGASVLLGCALPGLVALVVGVRELNRWTRWE